jgi:hypothetical protein
MEGGHALIGRPTVVPYKKPKRAVPAINAEVSGEMLRAIKLPRSDFNAMGARGFEAVVPIFAAARAGGKRDMHDELAAADNEIRSCGILARIFVLGQYPIGRRLFFLSF